MNLVARAQAILMKPKEEWVKIKGESTPIVQLFTSYAVLLAAVPAVAQFIGNGLVGKRIPFVGWVRYPVGSALFQAILYYVFTLVTVYVFGIVINALAPSFGSKQSMENAMKLAVYSMTPMWIGGVFYIIPFLGFLAILASLYGLYILYLGFDNPLMDTPKDKVIGYLLVSIVVIVVLSLVVALVLGAIFTVGSIRGI
jgi:hypothetical protein